MAVLRSILTKFGFKVEGGKLVRINQQVGAVKRRLNAATRQARAFRRELGSTANMLRYAAYAFVGSRVVKAFTTDYADAADAAAKMSKAMGISVEFYQALGHAAGISGASIDDAAKAMMQLGKRARDAREGTKKTKDAFKELGLEVMDSNGNLKNQDVLLLEAADRFKALPDGTTKTALAMEVFGRAGAKIIPLLNEGSDGIRRMMQEAKDLGIVLSAEAAKDAELFNDELRRAKGILMGVRNTIASKILPKLTELITRFKEWYLEGNNAAILFAKLKKWAKVAGAALAGFIGSKMITGFMSLGRAIMSGVTALQLMAGAGMLAKLKLGLILVAVGGLIALAKDFSQTGAVFDGIKQMATDVWGSLKPALMDLANALIPVLVGLWDIVKPLIPYVVDLLVAVIKAFGDFLKMIAIVLKVTRKVFKFLVATWKAGTKEMAAFLDVIVQGWRTVADGIKAIWSGLETAWDATIGALVEKVKSIFEPFETLTDGIRALWDKTIGAIFGKLDAVLAKYKALRRIIFGERPAKKGKPAATFPETRPTVLQSAKAYKAWEQRRRQWQLRQLQKAPTMPISALSTITGSTSHARREVQRSISVGSVNVNISGTTNMNAPEVQDAVERGARRALNKMVREAHRDLKPATAQ